MSARRELIRRLSEDSLGGIATLQDVTDAEQLLDAYRAEVLRQAADAVDRLSMQVEQDMKTREIGPLTALQDAADELRRMADLAEAGGSDSAEVTSECDDCGARPAACGHCPTCDTCLDCGQCSIGNGCKCSCAGGES